MIARLWRGWTTPNDADTYEALLKDKVLPALRKIEGYRGGYVLRGDGSEVEFVVMSLFESFDSVIAFAGDDYERPVFEPEALKLLCRKEQKATHYQVRSAP